MDTVDLTDRKSLIGSLPPGGVAAEIGVAAGEFSQLILETNRPRLLYLIDCWAHQSVEICGHDPSNVSDDAHEELYRHVIERFAANPAIKILRAYSPDVAARFADNYFDWLHFDGNHLQLRAELLAWWPKVRAGGWFTGHDYTVAGDCITVKTVVDDWVAERGLELFVTRGDNDIYEKNYPTWAFKKPERPCLNE